MGVPPPPGFSCRLAKELYPVYCEHSVSMQTCKKKAFLLEHVCLLDLVLFANKN